MKIIVALKEQLAIVQELAALIWPSTYGKILSSEQIEYMMDMMYSIESLEKQLQNNRIFLFAEEDNKFVGFASYELNCDDFNTRAEGELIEAKTKIHKLYVLPERQGKGIGRQLIDFIANIALKNQNTALFLTVNKNNNAKYFYLKNGFEITQEAVFDIGNGFIMDDYIMEKKL